MLSVIEFLADNRKHLVSQSLILFLVLGEEIPKAFDGLRFLHQPKVGDHLCIECFLGDLNCVLRYVLDDLGGLGLGLLRGSILREILPGVDVVTQSPH